MTGVATSGGKQPIRVQSCIYGEYQIHDWMKGSEHAVHVVYITNTPPDPGEINQLVEYVDVNDANKLYSTKQNQPKQSSTLKTDGGDME